MIDANIKPPSIFTKFFLFSSMSHNYQTSFKFLNLQSPSVQTTHMLKTLLSIWL